MGRKKTLGRTMAGFQGEKLKKARLYRGLTLTELAEETGVSKQALSKYEKNQNEPTPSNLFALARSLNFPISYFKIPSECFVQGDGTYFRSRTNTAKKKRVAQTVRTEFIASVYQVIAKYISFPELDLPDIGRDSDCYDESDHDFYEYVAQKIRTYWGIPNGPIEDLRYVIESHGVLVSCSAVGTDSIDAFSSCLQLKNGKNDNVVFVIVIAAGSQSICRARFDMAHELAHIVLHPWSTEEQETISSEVFRLRERQANAVASSLLMPKEEFISDLDIDPTNLAYYLELKKRWGVSVSAALYRARELNVLTANQYQYLMRQVSSKGWRRNEPGDEYYMPSGTLLQESVRMLLKHNIVSKSEFMDELAESGIGMKPEEIEKLLGLPRGMLEVTQESADTTKLIQFKLR